MLEKQGPPVGHELWEVIFLFLRITEYVCIIEKIEENMGIKLHMHFPITDEFIMYPSTKHMFVNLIFDYVFSIFYCPERFLPFLEYQHNEINHCIILIRSDRRRRTTNSLNNPSIHRPWS